MPVVADGCALVGVLVRGGQIEPAGRGLRARADRSRVAALCLGLAPVALKLVAELAQLVGRGLLAVESPAPYIEWYMCWPIQISYLNFKAVLALPKTARSAQTHKSISFI